MLLFSRCLSTRRNAISTSDTDARESEAAQDTSPSGMASSCLQPGGNVVCREKGPRRWIVFPRRKVTVRSLPTRLRSSGCSWRQSPVRPQHSQVSARRRRTSMLGSAAIVMRICSAVAALGVLGRSARAWPATPLIAATHCGSVLSSTAGMPELMGRLRSAPAISAMCRKVDVHLHCWLRRRTLTISRRAGTSGAPSKRAKAGFGSSRARTIRAWPRRVVLLHASEASGCEVGPRCLRNARKAEKLAVRGSGGMLGGGWSWGKSQGSIVSKISSSRSGSSTCRTASKNGLASGGAAGVGRGTSVAAGGATGVAWAMSAGTGSSTGGGASGEAAGCWSSSVGCEASHAVKSRSST